MVHGEESKQLAISFQPFLQPNTLISSDVLGQTKGVLALTYPNKHFNLFFFLSRCGLYPKETQQRIYEPKYKRKEMLIYFEVNKRIDIMVWFRQF